MVSRNPPRSTGAQPPQDSDSGAPLSGGEKANSSKAFQDAATEYISALVQISSRLQEKHQGAVDELAKASSPAGENTTGDELTNAYRDLLAAFQQQDVEKMKSIQTAYLSRIQSQYGEAEATMRNRVNEYTNAVQSAWQEAKTQLASAFQNYLSTVKSNCAKLPVESVDPATLAIITQGIAAVASYAHYVAQGVTVGAPPAKG
jgi:hypothetical protein